MWVLIVSEDNASELYNEYLGVYYDQYMALSDAKKGKLDNKFEPKNLFLKGYDDSGVWSEELTGKEESTDIPLMLLLEGDEKVKEGKGLKV